MKRARTSEVWTQFTPDSEVNKIAICNLCNQKCSFKSTISNLKKHIQNKHLGVTLARSQLRQIPDSGTVSLVDNSQTQQASAVPNAQSESRSSAVVPVTIAIGNRPNNADEDSNSSIKFSNEIWGFFDQEDSQTRCTLCRNTTENTVEDMKNHLEEEHPAVMIGILKKKPDENTDDNVDSETENVQEVVADEDIFTEVVYLDEEPRRKKPVKRTKTRPTENIDIPKIGYKVISQLKTTETEDPRPEIDSFLNYVSVLLKNVPKETIPKLQLEIISLILNAQIARSSNYVPATDSQIPVASPTITVSSEITNVKPIHVVNSTGNYHFTIENKELNSN